MHGLQLKFTLKIEGCKLFFVSLFYFMVGAAVLMYGFKKNNRDLLTIAAFIWLAPGALEEMSRGFIEGYKTSKAGVASIPIRYPQG